jgi:hypothetical protein
MEFRPGAGGKNFVPRLVGENQSGGSQKENCGQPSARHPGSRPVVNVCHDWNYQLPSCRTDLYWASEIIKLETCLAGNSGGACALGSGLRWRQWQRERFALGFFIARSRAFHQGGTAGNQLTGFIP